MDHVCAANNAGLHCWDANDATATVTGAEAWYRLKLLPSPGDSGANPSCCQLVLSMCPMPTVPQTKNISAGLACSSLMRAASSVAGEEAWPGNMAGPRELRSPKPSPAAAAAL